MATAPRRRPTREIKYPTGDGKPMAETDQHRKEMVDLIQTLEHHYSGIPNVYVSGNILLYYVEGDPCKHFSPDVLVCFDIPKEPERDHFLVWKESKAPDVVFEITSNSTGREDRTTKWELYRDVLKVQEYFQFDRTEDYLKPPLQGFRPVDGDYIPIPAVEGRLPSQLLGLHLERDGNQLRLFDPVTGRRLLTTTERAEAAEAERRRNAEDYERLYQEFEALRRRSNSSSAE